MMYMDTWTMDLWEILGEEEVPGNLDPGGTKPRSSHAFKKTCSLT
jgi:hypothetical protein